jgi:phenylalanyl-tRNA synthetase beta chain
MKVSLNQIRQFLDFELPPTNELVARINSQLGGVEEVIDLADKYKDAKIVRVVKCEKHPNADRLNVTKIDDGTGELIQVVCGAPNVHTDMWAIWLPPESIVPATYDDAEPFKLGARELRGVMSHGMLAAGDELALNDDHEGIIEVTEADVQAGKQLFPGASFAETFGLDDTVIDIENKMFTHRPDCFGQLGVAREIAGISGRAFTSPDWYSLTSEVIGGEGLSLDVFNETDNVSRFMAVALENVTIKPSPLWLQCALVAMGSKPINNVVDATNYIMLITAQPTHAYDYDKIRGNRIGARQANDGEKVKLLNGKEYELTESDIVIADTEGPIGLGGIMGGSESEVSAGTTRIVLEVATFDMYAVRRTAMRHGVFTDALTRFNKGQSPMQNLTVIVHLANMVTRMAGANVASPMYDLADESRLGNEPVTITDTFINSRLGLKLDKSELCGLLENVEIDIVSPDGHDTYFEVTAPFWRTDIELPEDIVEEVGRLYGFDKLPRELPQRSTTPAPHIESVLAKQRIRDTLARAGANEVLTYSFVHANVAEKAGQDVSQAFKLSNALSPDLQYYRLSILPSLLDKVHMNIKAGNDEFTLFEIGKGHHVDVMGKDTLPSEFGRVGGVYASRNESDGATYYQIKHTVEYLIRQLRSDATISYTRLDEYEAPDFKPFTQMLAPFDPVRSAIVEIDGKLAGVVGEPRAKVIRNFKLPAATGIFELFLSPFEQSPTAAYVPLSKYPSVQRDVSFKVSEAVQYQDLLKAAGAYHTELEMKVSPLDIYQAENETTKTITLRFVLTSQEKTLTSEEVSKVIDRITASAVDITGAQVI